MKKEYTSKQSMETTETQLTFQTVFSRNTSFFPTITGKPALIEKPWAREFKFAHFQVFLILLQRETVNLPFYIPKSQGQRTNLPQKSFLKRLREHILRTKEMQMSVKQNNFILVQNTGTYPGLWYYLYRQNIMSSGWSPDFRVPSAWPFSSLLKEADRHPCLSRWVFENPFLLDHSVAHMLHQPETTVNTAL